MKSKRQKVRYFIKLYGSAQLKRFINITSIYDSGGVFSQFKITFEGIKRYTDWTFATNAVADSVHGVREVKEKFSHTGQLSVGYHADGNVLCKMEGKNFRPSHYPAVKTVKKPILFLRMSGFLFDNLDDVAEKREKADELTLDLKDVSNQTILTCDFYISNQRFALKPRRDERFVASQTFTYADPDTLTHLHLHFYKTDKPEFYVVVPKRGFFIQIRRYFTYFWWTYVRPSAG